MVCFKTELEGVDDLCAYLQERRAFKVVGKFFSLVGVEKSLNKQAVTLITFAVSTYCLMRSSSGSL